MQLPAQNGTSAETCALAFCTNSCLASFVSEDAGARDGNMAKSTEIKMACKFCEVGAGVILNEIDCPIYENADYYAVSSVGGFVPGWTLIFPKKHTLNMSSEYAKPAFSQFVSKITAMVHKEYGQCVHFEHGATTQDSQTGCGVHHAHLHIVPFAKGLESLVLASHPNLAWRKLPAGDIEATCHESEYLFCSDEFNGAEATGLLAPLTSPESQFFRKLIAISLGLNALYDYKRHRFEELSLSTATHLRQCFSMTNSSAI